MKIIFKGHHVCIESKIGTVEGDSMLHYHIAKLLWNNGDCTSDIVDDMKKTRTVILKYPVED